MINTAILDPDPFARQHIVTSLDHAPGISIVCATGEAETLLLYLQNAHCDVIVVEPRGLPEGCNHLSSAMSQFSAPPEIVCYTSGENDSTFTQAMMHGARAYIVTHLYCSIMRSVPPHSMQWCYRLP